MIPRPATGGLGMPGEESVRPYIDEYQGVTDSSAPIAAHQVAAASFRAASVGHSTSNQNNRQRLPDALARKQPIAMAVWAAAFSCVVLIQGGSAPCREAWHECAWHEADRQIRDKPRSLGGSPENRNRRAGRSLFGYALGEPTGRDRSSLERSARVTRNKGASMMVAENASMVTIV